MPLTKSIVDGIQIVKSNITQSLNTSVKEKFTICKTHKVRMKPVGNGFECPVCTVMAGQQKRGRRR
jgi:hypothetical protein